MGEPALGVEAHLLSPLFTLRAANPTPRPPPQRAKEGELNIAGCKVFCVGGGIVARVSTQTLPDLDD